MTEEKSTRVYELGYILVPTTPEADVAAAVDTLKNAIASEEGVVKTEGAPEYIDLAYQMEKHVASKIMKWNQGYFGWIKFEAAPEALVALKKVLDANTSVIRYLLVKTSMENAVIFRKPKIEAVRGGAVEEELFDESEVSEEPEDMKEDHEKLPDVNADLDAIPEVATEPTETEEV